MAATVRVGIPALFTSDGGVIPLLGEGASPELLAAAAGALRRREARRGENINEWARTLAADLAKFTD